MPRPDAVAFDVIETLVSLEPLRARLERSGLAAHALETVFAEILRDAFALDTVGIYRPFSEVATSVLMRMGLGEDVARDVLAVFPDLPVHEDVVAAVSRLAAEGLPMIALTNGNADVTRTIFDRAGILDYFQAVVSIDSVQRWKPAAEVYRHGAAIVGISPDRLALVASHDWDLQGAKRAGLMTAYAARGKPFSTAMDPPDVRADSVSSALDALLAL